MTSSRKILTDPQEEKGKLDEYLDIISQITATKDKKEEDYITLINAIWYFHSYKKKSSQDVQDQLFDQIKIWITSDGIKTFFYGIESAFLSRQTEFGFQFPFYFCLYDYFINPIFPSIINNLHDSDFLSLLDNTKKLHLHLLNQENIELLVLKTAVAIKNDGGNSEILLKKITELIVNNREINEQEKNDLKNILIQPFLDKKLDLFSLEFCMDFLIIHYPKTIPMVDDVINHNKIEFIKIIFNQDRINHPETKEIRSRHKELVKETLKKNEDIFCQCIISAKHFLIIIHEFPDEQETWKKYFFHQLNNHNIILNTKSIINILSNIPDMRRELWDNYVSHNIESLTRNFKDFFGLLQHFPEFQKEIVSQISASNASRHISSQFFINKLRTLIGDEGILALQKKASTMQPKPTFFNKKEFKVQESDSRKEALAIGQELQKKCKAVGIPVVFTAQKLGGVTYQIIVKTITERLHGDFGKARKIFRIKGETQHDIESIKKIQNSDASLDVRFSTKSSAKAQSAASFLAKGMRSAHSDKGDLKNIRQNALPKFYLDHLVFALRDELHFSEHLMVPFLAAISQLYEKYLDRGLNDAVLIALMMDPPEETPLSDIIYSCVAFGGDAARIETCEELFELEQKASSNPTDELQARVLAATPDTSDYYHAVRIIPESENQRTLYNQFKHELKDQVYALIEHNQTFQSSPESTAIDSIPLNEHARMIFMLHYPAIRTDYHSTPHAARTSFLTAVFWNLYRLLGKEEMDISPNELKIMQIVGLMHDSQRTADGIDMEEKESAQACKQYLSKYFPTLPENLAGYYASTILSEHKPTTMSKIFKSADSLEFVRFGSDTFDKEQMAFFNDFRDRPEVIALIDNLVHEASALYKASEPTDDLLNIYDKIALLMNNDEYPTLKLLFNNGLPIGKERFDDIQKNLFPAKEPLTKSPTSR